MDEFSDDNAAVIDLQKLRWWHPIGGSTETTAVSPSRRRES